MPKESIRESPEGLSTLLQEVAALSEAGLSVDDAARIVGVDIGSHHLPAKFPYVPTPNEIKIGCERIRRTWTAEETKRRKHQIKSAWEFPRITTIRTSGDTLFAADCNSILD